MGLATDRPYGQDGGVVQLPLALDKILAGESPYGADYSGTILGRIARASAFWEPYGGNPILRHHAYLPGTHLVMMPFYLLCRPAFGVFDPRFVTLLFYGARRVARGAPSRRRPGPAQRGRARGPESPRLLAPDLRRQRHRLRGSPPGRGAARARAAARLERRRCSVSPARPSSWPGPTRRSCCLLSRRPSRCADLGRREAWERLLRSTLVAACRLRRVVLPVAALDFHAFYGDIVAYNVGLPGADNYPLGGTPGLRLRELPDLFRRAWRASATISRSASSTSCWFPSACCSRTGRYARARPVAALLTGTVALLASLYFSRVVHPNYLIPAAILLPLALLTLRRAAGRRPGAPGSPRGGGRDGGRRRVQGGLAGGRRDGPRGRRDRPARVALAPRGRIGPDGRSARSPFRRARGRLRGGCPRRWYSPGAGAGSSRAGRGGRGPRGRRSCVRRRPHRRAHRRPTERGRVGRAGLGGRGTPRRRPKLLRSAARERTTRARGLVVELPSRAGKGASARSGAPATGAGNPGPDGCGRSVCAIHVRWCSRR